MSDTLENIIDKVIEDNKGPVSDFKNGRNCAGEYLMGQVIRIWMNAGNQKPDPINILTIIKTKLLEK